VIRPARLEPETNGHTIQKSFLRAWLEIVAHEKNQFVLTAADFGILEQGRFGAAIGVGSRFLEQPPPRAAQRPQFNPHPAGGTSARCVKNMSAQLGAHTSIVREIAQAKPRDFVDFLHGGRDFLLARMGQAPREPRQDRVLLV